MLLTSEDVKRIEMLGFSKTYFCIEREGFIVLKNNKNFCVFYDVNTKRCKIYEDRPIGCRFYPIIYDVEHKCVTVDKLCHLWHTVTKEEIKQAKLEIKKLVEQLMLERNARLKIK